MFRSQTFKINYSAQLFCVISLAIRYSVKSNCNLCRLKKYIGNAKQTSHDSPSPPLINEITLAHKCKCMEKSVPGIRTIPECVIQWFTGMLVYTWMIIVATIVNQLADDKDMVYPWTQIVIIIFISPSTYNEYARLIYRDFDVHPLDLWCYIICTNI